MMKNWRARIVIWLCNLFRMDYVLSQKLPTGVMTKINASRYDLFLILCGIVLSMRKSLEANEDEEMLREMMQNMVEKWDDFVRVSDKMRERS